MHFLCFLSNRFLLLFDEFHGNPALNVKAVDGEFAFLRPKRFFFTASNENQSKSVN